MRSGPNFQKHDNIAEWQSPRPIPEKPISEHIKKSSGQIIGEHNNIIYFQ